MKQLKLSFLLVLLMSLMGIRANAQNYDFGESIIGIGDEVVKSLLVANWDTNGDSEISFNELYAVTDIGDVFKGQAISSFNDFMCFTGLMSIGDGAFSDCAQLKQIIIPKNVKNIGNYAFSGCKCLEYPHFGNWNETSDLISVGKYAFANCEGLLYIIIPEKMTSISEGLLYGCVSLESVTIPSSVTSIGVSAFEGCASLPSIVIPENVTTIGEYAFKGCNNLVEVKARMATPPAITSSTFSNRANATLYVYGGSKAAYEAADYWKEFKEIVEIPAGNIEFADAKVKELCVNMPVWNTNHDGELSYEEAAAVTNLYDIFEQNEEITSFNELQHFIGLTNIGESAFRNCSGLTSITIPNSVTSIEEAAFFLCSSLSTITIPSSVMSIGYRAFYGCDGLTEVRSLIENPFQIDSECFSNYDIPLYVPAGTKEKYMATEGWKNFTNIVEMESDLHYDVTNNGEVDNDDVNSLIDVVMNRAEAVETYTYDVNNDNKVDIADVTCVIDRILYLERMKTLSTGSEDEVRTMLEDLSGTSHLNASDAAAALTSNPNVEEAYTEDGNNVIVKMSGESGLTMYPCYELRPVFSDEMIPNSNSRISQQRGMKRQTRASKGRIAIFSFFDYNQKYRQQSKIVDELYLLLDHYNGYDVEFYGVEFTSDKLKEVINSSSDYKAIIIMSYGGIGKDDKSYIATREKSTSLTDVRMKNLDPDMKDYYKMIPTDELLKVSDNCILYLGASCSVPYQGLGGRSNIIGWRDKTSVIQTHAYLLFTAMTEHGLGLKDALESIPSNDPFNENASLYAPYADNTLKLPGATTNQEKEIVFTESISKSKYYKKTDKKNEDGTDICIFVDGRVLKPENGGLPSYAKITLKPLLWSANGDTRTVELYVNDDYSGLCDHFAGQFYGSELEEGVYEVQITALYGDHPDLLYPEYPLYYVVSSKFSDTYAPPVMPVAGMSVPVVRTKYNQMVDEVKLAPGGTKSYVIDGYEGHQFKVSGGDDDIVTATISDNTLTIKGGTKLGPTAIYVDDVDNHHSAVVSIELFEFDELVLQSYETKSMKKGDVYLVMITSGSGEYIVTSSQPDKATADVMKSGTSYYVKVTALATGSSTITVNDNESGEVKEFDVKVEGVDLKLESNDVLSLRIGEQWVLKIISGNGEYTVESSQPDKVTATIFRSGPEYFVKVVGNEVGASSITVTDKLGKQTGFQVSVVSAVDFTLGRYYFNNLEVGEKDRVEITSGYGEYTAESSDPLVATASIGNVISLDPSNPRDVDYVEVEGKKAGSACITVTDTKSGQKQKLEVFVGTVGLALAVNSVNLYETGEEKKVKITSGNGGYTAVSNRTSVATVSIEKEFNENAVTTYVNIKAVDAGPATITVTDSKGKTATIQVQVTPGLVCLTCPDDHHPHMIDLGLPSGTLWACCNVGASKPEDYGGYYAWGEWKTKVSYNWNTYQYGSSWGRIVNIGSDIAGTQYDVATANWGAPWQMPTLAQIGELLDNIDSEWTMQNGVEGRKYTGENGGTIFMPAAGFLQDDELTDGWGFYWSSTPEESTSSGVYSMTLGTEYGYCRLASRYLGLSVRPVRLNGQ